MKYLTRSNIFGEVEAPKSKSIIQRKLISSFLSGKLLDIDYQNLAYDIEITHKALNILELNNSDIYIAQSGFCARVLPIIASIFNDENRFLIHKSLAKRPITNLLNDIGLNSEINKIYDDFFELSVKNKISSGEYFIDCSITSQILTGLLMALPYKKQDSIIIVKNLTSKPYIDLTIDILKTYSIEIVNSDSEYFIKGGQKYSQISDYEESDWSGAAFLISAAVINSEKGVRINGLSNSSIQADKDILKILEKANVQYEFSKNQFFVKKSEISAFEHDFSNCPDLVPAILPLAINSNGICKLKNISRLKYKESNRVNSLIVEYQKCGIKIEYCDNDLIVYPDKFRGTKINSHNDHRILMSLAVSGLNSDTKLEIDDTNCVNKSYPNFWNDLKLLGAEIN